MTNVEAGDDGLLKSSTPPKPRQNVWRRLLTRMGFLLIVSIAGLYFLSMTAPPSDSIGVTNGRLAECPASPNCVSTQSGNEEQAMPPISFSGPVAQVKGKIKQAIEAKFSRAKLVGENDNYLHYEFTSLIFRFVDDVEFLIDDESNEIHFRSASRVGHSDMGANRKRMQTIVDELMP